MQSYISLITRREDLSYEQFRQYYEEQHAPLALTFFPPKLYQRNYIEEAAVTFDCISEFAYDDDVDLLAVMSSEAGPVLAADEAQFMQREATITAQLQPLVGEMLAEPYTRRRQMWLFNASQQAEVESLIKGLSADQLKTYGASLYGLQPFWCESFPYALLLLVEKPQALAGSTLWSTLLSDSALCLHVLSCPSGSDKGSCLS